MKRITLGPMRHHYHPDPERIRHLLETSLEWKAQRDKEATVDDNHQELSFGGSTTLVQAAPDPG